MLGTISIDPKACHDEDDDDDDDDDDDHFHTTPASALPKDTAIAEASTAGGRTAETRAPFVQQPHPRSPELTR